MRWLAGVVAWAWVAIPAIGFQRSGIQPVPGAPGFPAQPGPASANYKPPSAEGPIVELLDEEIEPLFPLLNNISGESGVITREDRDVFAGVESARVAPMQRYNAHLPGWNFKIVETPNAAGEFRYLRFAWKKLGGTGMMVQLHDPVRSWAFRFHAGRNVMNWQPSKSIAERIPAGWDLVTLDLFKEYGAFTISGFALSPLDGQAGLFDHMLLGRSIKDLDRATDTALGRVKAVKPLAGAERDALWNDLLGRDSAKAGAAMRAYLATALDQVDYIRQKLATSAPDREVSKRIQRLIADLDDDSFDVRDAATDELIKLGAPVVEQLRALMTTNASDEVRYRAKLILKKLGGDGLPLTPSGKMARVVRVLERAGGRDARDLLKKMSEGAYGFDGAEDAKAALARIPNIWKR